VKSWWAREDSNLQPSGYEPLALTIELRAPTAFLATGEAPGQSLAPWRGRCRPRRASDGDFPVVGARYRFSRSISQNRRLCYLDESAPCVESSAVLQPRVAHMLPNFTIVVCGAVLTVIMLAVTGSGLITPETRTRIGAMPEVGRPMMQHLIAEPAGQARIAMLEVARRAEEIGRLRDLPPSFTGPAPAVADDRRGSGRRRTARLPAGGSGRRRHRGRGPGGPGNRTPIGGRAGRQGGGGGSNHPRRSALERAAAAGPCGDQSRPGAKTGPARDPPSAPAPGAPFLCGLQQLRVPVRTVRHPVQVASPKPRKGSAAVGHARQSA
jgi:hypothetical protein